jgi:hypothetical protein
MLADKKGVPLSIVITSVNTHDMKATAETPFVAVVIAVTLLYSETFENKSERSNI